MKKGCLTRLNNEIKSNGSQIKSCHKQWNILQDTFSCGIENLLALGHNHTLRTNIWIIFGKEHLHSRRPFLASTHGSHHIDLIDHVAKEWNCLVIEEKKTNMFALQPKLKTFESHEQMGLVSSDHIITFAYLAVTLYYKG